MCTRYLDAAALKKAKQADIEIGTVEGGGVKATVVAEIRRGVIVQVRPQGCGNCQKGRPRQSVSAEATKEAALEALRKARELGVPTVKLPIPVAMTRGGSVAIPIGPIVIVVGGPWDICIIVDNDDGSWCIYCLIGQTWCLGPTGGPELKLTVRY